MVVGNLIQPYPNTDNLLPDFMSVLYCTQISLLSQYTISSNSVTITAVRKSKNRFCLPLLFFIAAYSGAQEFNAVPLDHAAYDIIAMGVIKGIILPPPSAKPWSLRTVREKLQEMLDDPAQLEQRGQALSENEVDIIISTIDSFERRNGFDLQAARVRLENDNGTFEAGIGIESNVSLEAPDTSCVKIDALRLYTGGDIVHWVSWNLAVLGEKYLFSSNPSDISFDYGVEGALNFRLADQRLQLRLGRIRRDWGHGSNGTSLFMNAHAHPFAAFEGTVLPLPWMNISVLTGVLEQNREKKQLPEYSDRDNHLQREWSSISSPPDKPISNVLSAARIEFSLLRYFRFDMGAAATWLDNPNAAFFSSLELRWHGLFSLWGSIFIDRLDISAQDFTMINSNSYAYQVGIRANVQWLPFSSLSLRYSKVEPYCYGAYLDSAFVSDGKSLGYYQPPNSDELLMRFESIIIPAIKAYTQFQMIRHGADYGYGAVGGSSLHDKLSSANYIKYFLMDGVYQWDNVIKAGGTFMINAGKVPLVLYAEAGYVMTRFTINGTAESGNEADYEKLDNSVYRSGDRFIFSAGVRLLLTSFSHIY